MLFQEENLLNNMQEAVSGKKRLNRLLNPSWTVTTLCVVLAVTNLNFSPCWSDILIRIIISSTEHMKSILFQLYGV